MCMISNVHDHFSPVIPTVTPQPWIPWENVPVTTPGPWDLERMAELLKAFQDAKDAAKKFDALTGQPDCLDPEKAKLEDRIKQLEAALASNTEFTVTGGKTLEPGRYRIRIMLGDRVKVQLSAYDLNRGRIVYRYK